MFQFCNEISDHFLSVFFYGLFVFFLFEVLTLSKPLFDGEIKISSLLLDGIVKFIIPSTVFLGLILYR